MRILIVGTLVFIMAACTQQNDVSEVSRLEQFEMKSTNRELKFQLNDRLVNSSICLIPYITKNGDNLLYYLSGYTNKICVLNIDSQKLLKTIRFKMDGPNAVGDIRGFEVLAPDSIYITSSFRKILYLVNEKAEIKGKLNYGEYSTNDIINTGASRTFGNMRMHRDGSTIYLPFDPGTGSHTTKPEDIRYVAKIDTVSKTVNVLPIGFPEGYWDENLYSAFIGFFHYSNNFYVQFYADNKILKSPNGTDWKTYEVPSKYIDVKETVKREEGKEAHYIRLVPDPYRNVFYRFAIFQQKNRSRTNIELIRYPKQFSVIILDKDLNIIGETVFPEDIYDVHGYFITEEGMYLSRSHVYNPEYKENELVFELFELTKK